MHEETDLTKLGDGYTSSPSRVRGRLQIGFFELIRDSVKYDLFVSASLALLLDFLEELEQGKLENVKA